MAYLLWVILTAGGLFMGLGAAAAVVDQGFDLALALNAVLYLGCGVYALPRLVKLVSGKS